MRVALPEDEQARYGRRLAQALALRGLEHLPAQYFLVVDRNPHVQAVLLYWKSPEQTYHFVGATPCSTGRPGEFEHFATPLGVFEHSLQSLDFRAEGTRNVLGIRGYGAKGMRVYDFGWVMAQRGWDPARESPMRLQVHSTDPDMLEPRLGIPHSKGCVRIPASLNRFIDRRGLLDAAYNEALAQGRTFWVLPRDRLATSWAGRYLVVIESDVTGRPAWSTPGGASSTPRRDPPPAHPDAHAPHPPDGPDS